MRKLTTSEVKETVFQILCAFADFCDANSLSYYLCAGTLLGAVRHKDFIPWDDDVDVLMPRNDYEKMHQLLNDKTINHRYKLQSYLFGNHIYPFAKLIDTETTAISQFNKYDNALWIDIFPLDGLSGIEKEDRALLNKAKIYRTLFGFSAADFSSGQILYKKILRVPMVLYTHCFGHNYYANKINELAHKYDLKTSEYIAEITWCTGYRERMKKEDFLHYAEVEFHGRTFHAPGCWDEYLRALYGDYMKIPPENARRYHTTEVYVKE